MAKSIRASRPYMPEYGVLPADQGSGLLPWSWAQERLTTTRNFWVATVTPAGLPHCMPVFAVWHGDALFFSTGGTSKKALNLESTPHCVVSTESAAEPVVVEGTTSTVDSEAELDALRDVYTKKYGHPFPPGSPVFRVEPRKVIGFVEEASQFPGSATRWHFD